MIWCFLYSFVFLAKRRIVSQIHLLCLWQWMSVYTYVYLYLCTLLNTCELKKKINKKLNISKVFAHIFVQYILSVAVWLCSATDSAMPAATTTTFNHQSQPLVAHAHTSLSASIRTHTQTHTHTHREGRVKFKFNAKLQEQHCLLWLLSKLFPVYEKYGSA